MFTRKLNDDITLSLSIPGHSKALLALIEQNRGFLRQWVPWVDSILTVDELSRDLNEQLTKFAHKQGLHATIFYQGEIAGVISYQYIDHDNNAGYLGYWLGKAFNGKGIMTLATKDMIEVGFEYFSLKKIDIRCTMANTKSRAIPERLGFTQEGIARCAQRVGEEYFDQAIYGLIREEYQSAHADT
ncbi:MAG: GNAT family N-acetyltransferase [Alteromonadaceae bacterium]|nr:MAG: GNAT family N-acetyltransferase [Alteromonadaceae bacterium]